ncbi:glycerophosphoryl diester phosphodiesterase [Parafilimonas sp.]|uniref:glycerophosphoryl diester phosphodiesterase n=1 Tax=Parafilimonas sp. TaxID=1969739 RepID=UPI0039E3A927
MYRKKAVFIALLFLNIRLIAQNQLTLSGKQIRVEWNKSANGWVLSKLGFFKDDRWVDLQHPSGEYTLLYDEQKPPSQPDTVFKDINGKAWPDTLYHYQIARWKQATSPVDLNTAGKAYYFYPSSATQTNNSIIFTSETPVATITTIWRIDENYSGDIIVQQKLQCKQNGYYSLASPSVITVDAKDITWATMPGYFQGRAFEKNGVLSYGYGQGIPALPFVYRERCAGSLCPIISTKQNISFCVAPQPGLARDPWEYDKNTHSNWFVGLSHMNRKAMLSPTVYYPVLGEPHSQLSANDTIGYTFRYSFSNKEWYNLLTHIVNDVYDFNKTLALRHNKQSLVSRVEHMHEYVKDQKTSLWNIEEYKGLKIGGQSYLGGVVGSNKDAIKNSDYGAMWMLAHTTNDRFLLDSVLPYALNFKLAQQADTGFFKGAAIGQYYLANSKHFTEEWGEFVEPISLTYYIMLDMGNILLFEPDNTALKEKLRLGADLLLKWQKPDGSWEVAYDKFTHEPMFTDLKDLRPTFYGLLVAYRILKDKKYLDAAVKGANWYASNGVDKGCFIGVCGDARYAPDFATGQTAQAYMDLFDITKNNQYKEAAIKAARIYLNSIYTHPVANEKDKIVNGFPGKDWQISQSGLSFEHGGILGSANGAGPIMLCSHAGMFVRMFELTKDSLFIEMTRAAAIGRYAFVDSATSVASYYWATMNKGAGPYPHHAWWQIGWITDYLLSEAQMRSNDNIVFPRGFVTPKVGPHESYGFAPGKIYGHSAMLINRTGLITCDNPDVEYIVAKGTDNKSLFLILMNDTGEPTTADISINEDMLKKEIPFADKAVSDLISKSKENFSNSKQVTLKPYGLRVFQLQ